jgi:hypothetical protein
VRRIKRRSVKLSPGQVRQIVALFRDSTSWTSRNFEGASAEKVRAAFERIDRGVDRWNLAVASLALLVTSVGISVSFGLWSLHRGLGRLADRASRPARNFVLQY